MPAEKGIFLDVLPRFDMAALALILDKVTAMFKKTGAAMGATFGAEAEAKVRTAAEGLVRANNMVTDSEIRAERAAHAHEVARMRLNEITATGTARASTLARAQYAVADADALATARARDLAAARRVQASAEEAHATALAGTAIAAGNLGKVLNVGGMAATGGFLFTMIESGKAAGNFEERLVRLVASAGEVQTNLKTVADGLMNVATQTGYSANELADGMYLVEKAGYRGAEGIKVMRAAAQLARAENTSLDEVIQGLTTTLHDFHIPVDQAATVASKMNVAVGEAKSNLHDFSNALSSVEPTAAIAKMRLEEVYAALAQITQSGITPERASQNLNNTLEHLINIPMTQRTAMNKFGIDPDELKKGLGDPNVGLVGVLDTVQKKIHDHLTPEGMVWVDTYFQSASAVRALNKELEAIKGNSNVSDSAKKLAQDLVDGRISQKEFTADRKKETPSSNALLTQFEAGYKKSQGFSTNLNKLQSQEETVAQAYKEVFGTDAAFRVVAQLAGSTEALDDYAAKVLQLKVTTAEADGTVKGFNVTQETLNARLRDAKASFGNVAIQLGNDFLPALKMVADVLGWVARELAQHPGIMQTIAIALGALTTAWLTWKAVLVGRWFIDAVSTMVTWFGTLQARVALTISEMQGIVPAMTTSEAAVAANTAAMDAEISAVGATATVAAGEVETIGAAATTAEIQVAAATAAMDAEISTVGAAAVTASGELAAMGSAAATTGALAAGAISQLSFLKSLPLIGVGAVPDTIDPNKVLSGDNLAKYNEALKNGDSAAASKILDDNVNLGFLGPSAKNPGAGGDKATEDAKGQLEQQQALNELHQAMMPENPFTKAEAYAALRYGLGGLGDKGSVTLKEAIAEGRKRFPASEFNPGITPTPDQATVPRPDPSALEPSEDGKKKAKGKKDGPGGTKDDPIFTMPLPDPSLKINDGKGGTGKSGKAAEEGIGMTYDPFREAGQGGWTLPNVARLLATWAANAVLGNPYGHVQAMREANKKKGESASDPLYVQQVGVPSADGGTIQVTKSQLDMINASAREQAAQGRYDRMVEKYGQGSPQANNAAIALLRARNAKQILGLKQSGADPSSYLDTDMLDTSSLDSLDSTDYLDSSEPLAAESGYDGGGMQGLIRRAKRGRGASPMSIGRGEQFMLKNVDSALLSQVTPGRYDNGAVSDLSKGLADCSSAVEDLVNIMDGRPTAGRSMSTGNAAQWLTQHGFLPGSAPGAFNVGFNSHHMEATLPGGTAFNWGSDRSAASGGTAGAVGAFDPSFTSHYYRPVTAPAAAKMPLGPMPAGLMPKLYDTGGILPPGPTIVQNDTGQGEVVLNPQQQQQSKDMGVDPHALVHGDAKGAKPGPEEQPKPEEQKEPKPPTDPLKPGGGGTDPSEQKAVKNDPAKDGSRAYEGGTGKGFGIGGGLIGLLESLPGTAISGALGAAGGAADAAGGFGAGTAAAGAGSAAISAAMSIGWQELNRAVGYAGQVAGIGVQGLLETFGLNDSPIADPSKSLIGKIAGGIAGAHPTSQNSAGETATPLKPQDGPDPAAQPQQPVGAAPLVHIENLHNNGSDGQQVGRDISRQLMAVSPNGW